MADETPPATKEEAASPTAEAPSEATPKKTSPRRRKKAPPPAKEAEVPKEKIEVELMEGSRAPRRATLAPADRALLRERDNLDARRPRFGRQARYRYYRIGRDMSWRRPRGLQSKQRRHYGYRPRIVRVGYRSPARVRGLVPSGFRPIVVRTDRDLERIDAKVEAAVIARTIGTRRRLVLEEAARKLGIRVLNPIVKSEEEA
ncbi:MAG TPA: 50S ribosomal protein L32e [Thermoplasmata archaeon]|nr:50S ribosomal protein L32e [Thermoplasmata archaeon]